MNSVLRGALPATASRANYRVVCATVVVVALHLLLVALALAKHERIASVALESHVVTAELLQQEPVAAPAAIQSTPAALPKPVPNVTRARPKARTEAQTMPVPVAPAPSHQRIETQAPAVSPAAPAAASGPSAPLASAPASTEPAQGKPAMALNAPKNVSHLDCRIVEPDYPTRSRRLGETGTAYVRFVVGLAGQIENIELKKSSGFSQLDAAALEAMRESACKPYLENGVPVRAAYTQPFDFNLGG